MTTCAYALDEAVVQLAVRTGQIGTPPAKLRTRQASDWRTCRSVTWKEGNQMRKLTAATICTLVLGAYPGIAMARGAEAAPPTGEAAPAAAKPGGGRQGEGALLPANGAVPGWNKADNLRVFTKADLYGYINGGAELFLEFGFDTLMLQRYRNGTREVAVEIYRMADPVAAAGIYLLKRGKETPSASFRERHTLNRHQLMFQRNRYYVTINNLSGSEQAGPDLLEFGRLVAARLPVATPLVELRRLPPAGLVPGSERFFRGPFALQALFTLGDGDILQLDGRVTGLAANYNGPNGAYTLLLVDYPDAVVAKKAFAYLQENLDQYLEPTQKTHARLVFRDYEGKYGVATLGGRRVEIRLHLSRP